MSNNNQNHDLDFGVETQSPTNISTRFSVPTTPIVNPLPTEKPKKQLLSDNIYNGVLVQIYKREFPSKNGSKFYKYMYEVMIGNKLIKGNTYCQYLDNDMKSLNITHIKDLLGKQVRAMVTSATIETATDGVVEFNKIIRIWLTQPEQK